MPSFLRYVTLGSAVALVLAAQPVLAEAPASGPPASRQVDVFYTGFTGGLSSSHVDFAELRPLFKPDATRDFSAGGFVNDNVFRRGDFLIYTDAGPLTLEDFQAFFAAGPINTRALGATTYLVSDYAYVLAPPGERETSAWPVTWLADALHKGGGFSDVQTTTGQRYQLTNADGVHLYLQNLGAAAPPPSDLWDDPTRWEMLPAGNIDLKRGSGHRFMLAVGRPLGDGLRRSRLLLQLRREAPGPSLTVDAGNLLDPGFTQLSRDQREFTLLRLRDLHYDAVVPAETELGLPAEDWDRLRKLVPLVAANLAPRDGKRQPLPPHLIQTIGGVKIALIGIVDDKAMQLSGETGARCDWTASDAIDTTRQELNAVAPERPDAVIVVTNVREERLARMRQLVGITAVVGDFDGLPGDVYAEQVDVRGKRRSVRSLSTYMVAKASPNRVGHLGLTYDVPPGVAPDLRALHNEAYLVTDDMPEDEDWRWQLNITLDRFQSARRRLLLPDLREAAAADADATPALIPAGALPSLDRPLWSRLVANLMRRYTGAEVAVTRSLPVTRTLIGPVSQLSVEGWLDVGDHVVSTLLTGKQLAALAADDADANLLTFSGYDDAGSKVEGLTLVDDELYRVTTTDQVARHSLYQDVFSKAIMEERWHVKGDGNAQLAQHAGQPLLLRELVLDALTGMKASHGDAFGPDYLKDYAALLRPMGADVEPRWMLELDDANLLLNGYQNRGNSAYSQVLNPRVTTPDSFAAGGKGTVSATYDSKRWAWQNSAKGVYKRTTLHQNGTDISQKSDDEIDLTTEIRLNDLPLNLPDPFAPVPFVNGTYVTQFQPDDPGADGVPKPRRAELNAAAGLVGYPGFGIKEVRLGGVLKNDLVRPGSLEPGWHLIASFERKLDTVPLTLKGNLDATHYLPAPTDGPDRLGWLVDANATVSVPLWERLALNFTADYFLYQGKVPETSNWGSSLDFRIGLGYSWSFKPLSGVSF